MNKKWVALFLILVVLLSSALACQLTGGEEPAPPAEAQEEVQEEAPVELEEPLVEEEPEAGDDAEQAEPVEPAEPEEPSEPEQPVGSSDEYDTEFPLPPDVQNFMLIPQGKGGINYQTSMSLDEVVAFYRDALGERGLTERSLLTVIEDEVFSMVFDGDPNGAIAVQGVILGPDLTNVNMRYEEGL